MKTRDRFTLIFRVAGAISGLLIIVAAFATSSWGNGWVVAVFVLITVGGAISYHVLTSVVRCPACAGRVFNWRISSERAKSKLFSCRKCGTLAWLAEGFYWQREISG
ncbi:MAG: hypothetical protein WD795_16005 [Woeseia sp.]